MAVSGGSITGQHRHCLIDELDDAAYFAKWYERIESIPDHYIERACTDLFEDEFINEQERAAMISFLRRRRDSFRKIVNSNRNEFKGIGQWPLDL